MSLLSEEDLVEFEPSGDCRDAGYCIQYGSIVVRKGSSVVVFVLPIRLQTI